MDVGVFASSCGLVSQPDNDHMGWVISTHQELCICNHNHGPNSLDSSRPVGFGARRNWCIFAVAADNALYNPCGIRLRKGVAEAGKDDRGTKGAIAPRYKAIAVIMMATTFGVSFALGVATLVLVIQAIVLIAAAAFILSRPNGQN